MKKKLIIFFLFLFFPLFAFSAQVGDRVNFYVDSNYDLYQREKISATLKFISQKAYFFVDDDWWEFLSENERKEAEKTLSNLGKEFDSKIYPTLTSNFGLEWKPGIDNDERITVLFHKMKKEAGGYFNSGDEYLKVQNPKSNVREMVYLNSENILSPLIKSLLAHEFIHLITFNQKEKIFGVEEEVWLNEMRAEYAPTLLGYDNEKENNLQRRINQFLKKPTDSIVEWQGASEDYGVLNLFGQYLVERMGKEILIDSLKRKETGIASINQTLKEYGMKENFAQLFEDWTITVIINDCNFSDKYCYKSSNLRSLRILPEIIFLPLSGETDFSQQRKTQNWAGNWIRFIGGSEDLKIKFDGQRNFFRVPYITQDREGNFKVNYISLDQNQKGEVLIKNFRKDIVSFTFIPIAQVKNSDFNNNFYDFSYQVLIVKHQEENPQEIQKLLNQIEELKKQIAFYQEKINQILNQKQNISCQKIESDLFFGMTNNSQVRCLQEFLKIKEPELYPQGLVTGNFFNLTLQAVIRFQEKYASEILAPSGLQKGTGFVGPATRQKLNQLLSNPL